MAIAGATVCRSVTECASWLVLLFLQPSASTTRMLFASDATSSEQRQRAVSQPLVLQLQACSEHRCTAQPITVMMP